MNSAMGMCTLTYSPAVMVTSLMEGSVWPAGHRGLQELVKVDTLYQTLPLLQTTERPGLSLPSISGYLEIVKYQCLIFAALHKVKISFALGL